MALTERTIRDAKPGPKTRIEWDSTVKGFGLRVTAAGALAFVLNYRVDGRERRTTIGRPGEMSLKDARQRAGEVLGEVRAGGDPLRERQERREAPTVSEGVARFFDEWVPGRIADGRLKESTVREYRKQAKLTILPALGKLKIESVTRVDVERAVAPRAPVQRGRTLAFAQRLFGLFETWDWRPQHSNPARGIERPREEPRDRTLAPSEIEGLVAALDTIDDPVAAGVIRFLMMTGWRVGEALGLRWEDVNFETGKVTLPSTKAGRQIRPVAGLALELLASLPRRNSNVFIFGGKGSGPLHYRTVRARLLFACQAIGLVDVRLHDLRRSFATDMAAAGVSVFTLRDALGHKSTAMASRYARRADATLQAAQDAAAERVTAIMGGDRR